MSIVVTKNESILNQKVSNIDNGRVFLPFNVTKNQANKLQAILAKVQMTFTAEQDKLDINEIMYNGSRIEAPRAIMAPSKITLAKTYIATMPKTIATKVESFYKKLVAKKEVENPVFGITQEINLQEAFKLQQEALQEATVEISLDEINTALNANKQMQKEESTESQILANNPLGQTVIEDSIQPLNASDEEKPLAQQTPVLESQPEQDVIEKPKALTRKKARGNILVVPIIVIWLGLVLFGTIKLVTTIMS